ncbi:LysE family translocator [Variovorax sp. MHTC-1]|uniref:LysE family translocator n=1 Tax=Variovorax sp. MHTC-1 TaxID=2495593 RepID=UPI000F871C1F|nr:LysE family transporter [Variovorax sp. MHTC-1]RST47333.1 lysine transporter LysE [Variovorax sp. MHTC-1]
MLSTLLTVAFLHWLVLVTPGANVLLVSQLAASGHRMSACFAGLGVTVVAVTWALLAILGVNAIFASLPKLRFALQVAGGIYLCYVAVRLWRAGASGKEGQSEPLVPWVAFRLGFLTNILNPKSALFFGSIFATALPHEPSASLLAAVTALVFVNALLWHTFLAMAFSHRRIQVTYIRNRRLLNRVAGALVGAFGLRLLVVTANEMRSR